MPLTDRMQQYTAAVCEQVRWGRAHAAIATELESHMVDQYEAYCTQGMQEESAAAQAVAQMGDPVEVGVGLDRTHRPRPQWGLLALVALLATLIGVGLWRAWRQHSMLGRLVAFSTLLLLGCQLAGYLVFNLGLTILSPISLPLISYGGTVTVVNLLLIGLMLSALRSGEVALDCAHATLPRYKLQIMLERQR